MRDTKNRRAVVEALESRQLMDATTWSGQTSGSNGYGGTNMVDPMGTMVSSWSLQQQGLPGHTHVSATFNLSYQMQGTGGGQVVLSDNGIEITSVSVAAGSPTTGTIVVSTPNRMASNNATDLWQLVGQGVLIAGQGGHVFNGTTVGIAGGQYMSRAGVQGNVQLNFDNVLNQNTRVAFTLTGTAVPDPTAGSAWNSDYIVVGDLNCPVVNITGTNQYVATVLKGSKTAIIAFTPNSPYWGGPDAEKTWTVTLIPDPKNPANTIPANLGGVGLTTTFSSDLFILAISPHANDLGSVEMPDAQVAADVTALNNNDWHIRNQAQSDLTNNLLNDPSQYLHDELWADINNPATPPQTVVGLQNVFQVVWPDFQLTWDAANQELDIVGLPASNVYTVPGSVQYEISFGNSDIEGRGTLDDSSSIWTQICAPNALTPIHVAPTNAGLLTYPQNKFTVQIQEYERQPDGTFAITGQTHLWQYIATMSVYQPA